MSEELRTPEPNAPDGQEAHIRMIQAGLGFSEPTRKARVGWMPRLRLVGGSGIEGT